MRQIGEWPASAAWGNGMSKILIVDNDANSRNTLKTILGGEDCELAFAQTGEEALEKASRETPDLVLLDVMLPGMNGFDVCRHLRLDPLLAEIPVVMITAKDDRESLLTGLSAGADDVIAKPADQAEIRARVRNIMELRHYRKLLDERTENDRERIERERDYEETLAAWPRALELRGVESAGHDGRVAQMTVRLAREFGVAEAELPHIRRGALLHDSGMMCIPDAILLKPGPLTETEWQAVRKHPAYARDVFSLTPYLRPAMDIPYCHHEWWDGHGYPRGMKGEDIPLAARIFAVADVWDALTSDRPYRKAWPREQARAHIRQQAGKQFDPRVVEAFERVAAAAEAAPAIGRGGREAARAAELPRAHGELRSHLSLKSRGARAHFLTALGITFVIPILGAVYVATATVSLDGTARWAFLVFGGTALLLMGLGYGMLAKYPSNVVRLRRSLQDLARGNLEVKINLSKDEDDLTAIDRDMREIVSQTQERIRTIERQTGALLEAERQRVAIQGLGAACHHLGQPATTLAVALHLIRRANTSREVEPLIDECQGAAQAMADILQKLQHIALYRTEPYLASRGAETPATEPDILKL